MSGTNTHCWIDAEGPRRETDKAGLYETDEGEIWIPKSQIGEHVPGRLEVTTWWAELSGFADPKDAA